MKTNNSIDKILPCPFCGSAAERWSKSGVDYVGCRQKNCLKPKSGSTDVMTAVRRWNRREEKTAASESRR